MGIKLTDIENYWKNLDKGKQQKKGKMIKKPRQITHENVGAFNKL